MRTDIIKLITDPTGKLHHFCLKKDWWIKKDAEDLYNQVFLLTEFLDETTSFRERLFYIENNSQMHTYDDNQHMQDEGILL